ncbi:MAG: 30S ribosome-binding factor RbfA [Bdellovibrionales bacterium]|nr:30S ribosome-binding factor RbfA [Bdellovibrionales bacterium]
MNTDNRRVQRAEKELRQIIATYFVNGLKVPLPGVVTVAEVSVNPDMRTGKVFLSFIGSQEDRVEAEALLEEQTPEIQRYIGKNLKMKFCPKMKFFINHTTSENPQLEEMIAALNSKRG